MWTYCSGALIPNLLAPDDVGYEAAEGTVAHGVGELWLKTKKKPRHLIGKIEKVVEGDRTFDIEITAEMLGYVQVYVDACSMLPGDHHVETKVYFSHLTPLEKQGGTADHAACLYQHMTITDLKYGIGEKVFASENTQALLYALGFFYEWDWLYDFQTIEIRICQPRLDHFDTWTISREKLLSYEPFFRDAAHAAWRLDAPRRASPKACRWCKVKNDCAAHVVMQGKLMDGVFDDLTEPVTVEQVDEIKQRIDTGEAFAQHFEAHRFSNEEMGQLLKYRAFVESWWKAAEEEGERRVREGQSVPGWKLVHGRSSRRFIRNCVAAPRLIAAGVKPTDVYVTDVVSVAQAEKLLRKAGHRGPELADLLEDLVVRSPGKPTLAPESDPRLSIADVSRDVFDDLTETPETPEL